MPIVGVAAGALGASLLIRKVATTVNPKIMAGASMLVGLFMQRMSNPLIKAAGLGVAAHGTLQLGQSFGLISGVSGIGSMDVIPFRSPVAARDVNCKRLQK